MLIFPYFNSPENRTHLTIDGSSQCLLAAFFSFSEAHNVMVHFMINIA